MRSLVASVIVVLAVAATAASAAAPPRVQPTLVPTEAVVGSPWRAVVSISRPARATLEARGSTTIRAGLVRIRKSTRYAATLRFPAAGTWNVSAIVGGRRTRLGPVTVAIPRDLLLVDPFTIAFESSGALLVGNLRQGTLVRLSPGARAVTVADRMIGHLTVSPQGTVYALGDQALFRLDGQALVRVAGTGEFIHAGDGGPALSASFAGTTGAAVDAAGNVYVGEYEGWIRKIAPDGTVSTIAGTGDEGYSGDGGRAVDARFDRPHGLAIGRDGALYVADTLNRRIRRVDLATGVVSTVASDLGVVVSLAIAADGTIYAADVPDGSVGGGVSSISPSGAVTRIYTGNATNVAIAPDGRLYVVGDETRRVFRLDPPTRQTETVARG